MKDLNNYTILTFVSSGELLNTYTELFIIMKDDDFVILDDMLIGDVNSLLRAPIPFIRLIDSGRITSSELTFGDGSRYYLIASYGDIEATFPKHVFAKEIFKYRLNKKYK